MDTEFCGDLGPVGAYCAHTLTTQTRAIPKAQWDAMRVGWLCADSDGFNNTEKIIDQLCNETNLCDYETEAALRGALFRMEKVVAKIKHQKETDQ